MENKNQTPIQTPIQEEEFYPKPLPLTREEIKELIDVIGENHEIEKEDKEIIFRYEDAYDIETIVAGKEQINKYGTTEYYCVVECASKTEEIETPERLAQHCVPVETKDIIDYLKDKGVEVPKTEEEIVELFNQVLDKEANREIEEWNSKKALTGEFMGTKISIKPVVVSVKCYVNIPHYHYYKGFRVEFRTQNLNSLTAFLQLRDLLISLYPY